VQNQNTSQAVTTNQDLILTPEEKRRDGDGAARETDLSCVELAYAPLLERIHRRSRGGSGEEEEVAGD
jgi:hypothetical protein